MPRKLISNAAAVITVDPALGELQARTLTGLGAEVAPTTPEAAQRFLASEVARWTKLIRDEKIPPQN